MEQQEPAVDAVDGVPLNEVAAVYIKMRDKRAELKTRYEAEDEAIKNDMAELEQKMLDVCKTFNADSIRTDAGTIIRSVKSRYWTNDWDSMYRFIKEHDAYPLLEKRLHQSHMKQFLEENPNLEPVGLNVDKEYTVVVRRAK